MCPRCAAPEMVFSCWEGHLATAAFTGACLLLTPPPEATAALFALVLVGYETPVCCGAAQAIGGLPEVIGGLPEAIGAEDLHSVSCAW